jgi:hypothetical protein
MTAEQSLTTRNHIMQTTYHNDATASAAYAQQQDAERAAILEAMGKWICQRPGLEFCNYGTVSSYRAELRSITRDLADARLLLRAVELSSISTETLLGAFRAFSGRLSWDGKRLDYCTGQYWPTEYRKAVCAVLAAALWDWYRADFAAAAKPGESAGDAIRRQFRLEYGRGLARRWFDA